MSGFEASVNYQWGLNLQEDRRKIGLNLLTHLMREERANCK